MPTTLERILASTQASIGSLRAKRSEIEASALRVPIPPPLLSAWDRKRIALIAEVKRKSPSAGAISEDLDPVAHASTYSKSGASAVSVLTDGPFFGGSLEDLRGVSGVVAIPVLRKDFILDELQIAEARAAGASAVLLIVRALTQPRLIELLKATREMGLEALVEAHDARELDRALSGGATIVGINSRNLDNFHIDIPAAWALLARIPREVVAIAESGMASEADVIRAAEAGADGVLIGTALSSSPDPSSMVTAVSSVPRRGR